MSYFRICFPRNDSPVRSVVRFRSYASTLSRLVSSAQESQKLTLFVLFYYVKHVNSICKSSIVDPFQGGTPLDLIFLEWNPPFERFAFSEDLCRFLSHLRMLCLYITWYSSAFSKSHARRIAYSEDLCRHLSHLRMTCFLFASQYSAFPTPRAGPVAFSEDLYRFPSHLRMPCFNFTSCSSLSAVSYRSVHGTRVSTRRRSLCAGFAPIAFSTLVSYRCVRRIRTSTPRTALCAMFLRNAFSPTPRTKSNANNRHLSNDTLVSRSGAKTRQLSIICMTSLPFTSCYSCFLQFSLVR